MKHSILKKIVDLKKQQKELAIVTDLKNSNSTVYKLDEDLDKDFIQYKDQIDSFFKSKNNGVIDGTDIFVSEIKQASVSIESLKKGEIGSLFFSKETTRVKVGNTVQLVIPMPE